ncbi:ferrochelatase [Bacillus haynesii]|uniref:ferrochelatase n=1 Tax=Bacillus haynesii TaxID=1925021 RepID=UPI0022824EF3|nr:ferrochelatase [Bacillus haynesii]MCY8099024.1 ferrochelatase [Bacillus haynesii]MCY8468154.1 ferrochelatase [Bacillus haynesii]
MERKKVGLLVMAYGTPYQEEDIIPYYTHIRHGKRPSDDMIEDLKKRYKHIGGISPLAKITLAQAKELEKTLNERQDEVEYVMYLGLKHISPFIEDAVEQMKKDHIEEAVSVVLAPHYSTFSTEVYNRRAKQAAAAIGGPRIASIDEWYQEEGFIRYWSEKIGSILNDMSEKEREKAVVVCSAHSLPEKIKEHGDPYPDQLEKTAKLIGERLSFEQIAVGWQSEGNTPDPWLGPDVQDLTKELYQEGFRSFIYAPVGFVSDHLEVLYDNDFECKVITDELGASYHRPPMPNTDPRFIDTLASVVERTYNITEQAKAEL